MLRTLKRSRNAWRSDLPHGRPADASGLAIFPFIRQFANIDRARSTQHRPTPRMAGLAWQRAFQTIMKKGSRWAQDTWG